MAGVYFHIPYCKIACHYCDFHFSTQQDSVDQMVDAMNRELEERVDFLKKDRIETIYFGGGTPSILNEKHLSQLLKKLTLLQPISDNAEITLEANPDDIDLSKAKMWRELGFNRLSIGIQSFRDEDLHWMNRAHNAQEAHDCIANAKSAGFENLSIDLIYGIPNQSSEQWKDNVQNAINAEIQHLSAYCLTIENKTVFGLQKKRNQFSEKAEEDIEEEFQFMKEALAQNQFEHYEISNFAKSGYYSRHNSSYWQGISYLGIGPSAHSYDGHKREWNPNNNWNYIKAMRGGVLDRNSEDLSDQMKFNEYVLTGLRTIWGIDLEKIKSEFNIDLLQFRKTELARNEHLIINDSERIRLNEKGMLFADRIASELFL